MMAAQNRSRPGSLNHWRAGCPSSLKTLAPNACSVLYLLPSTQAALPGEITKMRVSMRGGPLEVWPESLWPITPRPFTGWPGVLEATLVARESLSTNRRSTRQNPRSRDWTCTQILQQLSYTVSTALQVYIPHGPRFSFLRFQEETRESAHRHEHQTNR